MILILFFREQIISEFVFFDNCIYYIINKTGNYPELKVFNTSNNSLISFDLYASDIVTIDPTKTPMILLDPLVYKIYIKYAAIKTETISIITDDIVSTSIETTNYTELVQYDIINKNPVFLSTFTSIMLANHYNSVSILYIKYDNIIINTDTNYYVIKKDFSIIRDVAFTSLGNIDAITSNMIYFNSSLYFTGQKTVAGATTTYYINVDDENPNVLINSVDSILNLGYTNTDIQNINNSLAFLYNDQAVEVNKDTLVATLRTLPVSIGNYKKIFYYNGFIYAIIADTTNKYIRVARYDSLTTANTINYRRDSTNTTGFTGNYLKHFLINNTLFIFTDKNVLSVNLKFFRKITDRIYGTGIIKGVEYNNDRFYVFYDNQIRVLRFADKPQELKMQYTSNGITNTSAGMTFNFTNISPWSNSGTAPPKYNFYWLRVNDISGTATIGSSSTTSFATTQINKAVTGLTTNTQYIFCATSVDNKHLIESYDISTNQYSYRVRNNFKSTNNFWYSRWILSWITYYNSR